MKKLLLVLPLVAGASWAGTTYYSGSQALPEYQQLLSSLNSRMLAGLPLRFEEANFERGFMDSQALTSLVTEFNGETQVLMQFEHAISHSPVVIDENGTRVGTSYIVTTAKLDDVDPEVRDKLTEAFGGADPLTVYTNVGLSGSIENNVVISPAHGTEADADISYSGANLNFTIADETHLLGNGSLGRLVVTNTSSGAVVDSGEFGLNFDFAYLNDYLYTGTSELTMSGASISANGMTMMSLDGLRAGTDISLASDTAVNMDSELSIATISTPMSPVESMNFDLNFNNVDIAALTDYIAFSQNMYSDIDGGMTRVVADPEATTRLVEELMDKMNNLLTADFGMDLDMTLTTGAGPLNARMALSLDDTLSGASTAREIFTPINASASFEGSEAAIYSLPMAPMFLPQLEAAYLTKEGDTYRFNASMDSLVAQVNGETIPLEAVLGAELDEPLTF